MPFPGPAKFISALILAYYLPGMVFLRYTENRIRNDSTGIVLALMLSPIVLTLIVLALHPVTGSLSSALKITYMILFVLLILDLLRRRKKAHTCWNPPRSTLIIPLLFAGTVLISYIINGFLLIRSDSWGHACYVSEIIDRGIPPFESRFPDIRLRYMWIYHLFQACFINLSGTSVFTALGVFNIVNAFAFPILVTRMVSFISTQRRHLLYIPLLSIAGLASVTWILWFLNLARAFSGDVRGLEEITRILTTIDLNGASVLHYLKSYWTWMVSVIDKFMTITAFGYTLNLFLYLAVVALDRKTFQTSRYRVSVKLLVILAGMILFHLITGITTVLMLIGALPVFLILSRLYGTGKAIVKDVATLSLAAVAASCLTVPYIISILGGAKGSAGMDSIIHVGIKNLLTIAAPLLILYFPCRAAAKKYWTKPNANMILLSSWLIVLLGINLFINLPGVNESKFIFPLFIILLPLIGIEIIDGIDDSKGIRRILGLTWVFLLFGIPSILTVRGFILEKPSSEMEQRRWFIDNSDTAVFDWIKDNSGKYSVIIERNTYGLMPVYAHRRNFFPSQVAMVTLGYSGLKVERYRKIRDDFFSELPFDQSDIDYLKNTGIDFLVIVWQEDEKHLPGLNNKFLTARNYFREDFRNEKARIFTLLNDNRE